MASSGTYSFGPAASNLALVAFSRIGIRRTAITAEHMADVDAEANLVQVELSNRQPLLWRSEEYSQALTQGTATYVLPARLIAIQAAYITTTSNGSSFDRLIWPLSAFEWSALPDKTTQGPPTSYFYDRLINPEMKLWPVPDGNATYTLKLRVLSQIQDVTIPGGVTLDMPYRYLDCFVAKLAHRLSRIYAPDKEAIRKADADEAWNVAAAEDSEDVPMYVIPAMGGYWN